MTVQNKSLIFVFFIFFITHFLLIENTYKNPYSLKAVNARYAMEYPLFAQFLALCRAQIITIPTIGLGSLHTKLPKCKVRIVFIRAQNSAKIQAKSLIVSEKLLYSPRTYKVKWQTRSIGYTTEEVRFTRLSIG
jgi:hypothetical protein